MLGVKYVTGTVETLCCDLKLKSILDRNSCEEAANSLGVRWNPTKLFTSSYPSGCIGTSSYVAFNEYIAGGRVRRELPEYPVCYNIKGQLAKYFDYISGDK